jgi:hypothetical protein
VTEWQRLREGDIKGRVMPLDEVIGHLRRRGWSHGDIARQIGKRRSYVQHRLMRIAAREELGE